MRSRKKCCKKEDVRQKKGGEEEEEIAKRKVWEGMKSRQRYLQVPEGNRSPFKYVSLKSLDQVRST